MKKPGSIWQFERLLLLSTMIDLLNHALNLRHTADLLNDPVMREIEFGWSSYMTILISGVGFFAIIWFFVVRKASNVARWTYATLVVFSSLQLFSKLPELYESATLQFLFIGAIGHMLSLYTTWLLFSPNSREWFASGRAGNRSPKRHEHLYRD